MSPADNAAKEPSMEEILASIRRIIEENDGPKDGSLAGDDLTAKVTELAAAESRVPGAAPRPDLSLAPQEPNQGEHRTSRRLPHERSDHDVDSPIAPRNPVMEPDTMTSNGPDEKYDSARYHGLSATTNHKSELIDDEVAAFNAALGEDDNMVEEMDPMADDNQGVSIKSAVAGNSASLNAISSMLSEQTAERVSASFGALTEAVDANRGSQMQNMTEKMLQPMLRDWLDNNLPLIVERLVREEIERLARGEM